MSAVQKFNNNKPGPKPAEGEQQTVNVQVVLSVETVRMLDELAAADERSRSAVLRLLIKKEFQARRPRK